MIVQNSLSQHSFLPQIQTQNPSTDTSNGSSGTDQSSTGSQITATDALGNETTFLQLLVAQIQNQDPTQPMDSSTFLTQLAEFTQVEQLIGIRQDVQQLDPATTSTAGTTSSTDPTSGS